MTERWFTDAQVQQVARDLQDLDATMADAMDYESFKWDELSDETKQQFVSKAVAYLSKMAPLDLSRPIRLRDGMPVYDVKLSEDGLHVLARVIAWGQAGTQASWRRDGRSGDDDHPSDLVYADGLV
jgi:hypothetical protein